MKPKYVQTKAQLQRPRNVGDSPSLGRVRRMAGGSNRLKIRKRARSGSGKRSTRGLDRRRLHQMKARKFAVTLWLSIILIGCFGALSAGMLIWLRSQGDRKIIAPKIARIATLPALHLTNFPPPSEREAMEIIRGAIGARESEMLRNFVHHTGEVDAAGISEFFAATEARDGNIINHQWIGSSDTEKLQIQSMVLAFNKDGITTNRLAMLVPSETGIWRLDFPSYARWCNPPIHLMNEPAGYPGGRVRVFLSRDHYFNGPFSDDALWSCFALASPDTETTIFAYSKIGSPEHQALEAILSRTARQARVTLEIDRVEGAQPRQFQITKVINQDWLAVEISTVP